MDDMSRVVLLIQLTRRHDLYVFEAGGETAVNLTTLPTLDPPLMNWRTSKSHYLTFQSVSLWVQCQ